MFTLEKSYKAQAECVKNLIDFCTKTIEKHKYPDTDIRTAALVNIRIIGYSTLAITNLLDSWAKESEIGRHEIPPLIGLVDVNEKSVDLMGYCLQKSSKLSLIVLGQFQIENFITYIGKFIGISLDPRFYRKSKKLITHLGLGLDKLEILITGALIRNSLHSNGIHHGYKGADFHPNLKGVQYDFENDKKVSCASLSHIAHALECSIEVLDEIICSTQIKSYTGLIEDKYVAQLDLD